MLSATPPSQTPPMALVGAGAVGSGLGRRLVGCGYDVAAVLSRREAPARTLASEIGASVASDDLHALPDTVRVVWVCVPDDALDDVAASLAAVSHPWSDTLVAHTSGARPASALASLADAGSTCLSFHPVQTFTLQTPSDAFKGIVVGVEGADDAVPFGLSLARELGARAVRIATEDKTRYHCAAALASNGLVALMAAVEEVLASIGVTGDDATALIRPLVDRTWQSLADASVEDVLTGPAARGDRGTIRAHLEALQETTPHLTPLYAALTTEAVRVARRSTLDDAAAASLLETVAHHLNTKNIPEDLGSFSKNEGETDVGTS